MMTLPLTEEKPFRAHHITYQTDTESLDWCLANTHTDPRQQYFREVVRVTLKQDAEAPPQSRNCQHPNSSLGKIGYESRGQSAQCENTISW